MIYYLLIICKYRFFCKVYIIIFRLNDTEFDICFCIT